MCLFKKAPQHKAQTKIAECTNHTNTCVKVQCTDVMPICTLVLPDSHELGQGQGGSCAQFRVRVSTRVGADSNEQRLKGSQQVGSWTHQKKNGNHHLSVVETNKIWMHYAVKSSVAEC